MRRLALVLMLLLAASPARGEGVFWATPVPLAPGIAPGDRVGALVFKGALLLAAEDRRFGGLSGLVVSDRGHVSAVSDRGYFVAFDLVEAEDGRLEGAASLAIERMRDAAGDLLLGGARDAEEIVPLEDGTRLVVFERAPRLGWFAAGSARERESATLRDLVADGNAGIEAAAALPDGRLLLIAERLGHWDGVRVAWRGRPGAWERLDYVPTRGDDVAGAALLPAGDLLVLERGASVLTGFHARLVRVPAAATAQGARLEGELLVSLETPNLADNFEGVAVRELPGGGAAIYLVSDDNYFALQRTYLVKFELPPL